MIKNNSKIAKNAAFKVNFIYLCSFCIKYSPMTEQTVVYIIFEYFSGVLF